MDMTPERARQLIAEAMKQGDCTAFEAALVRLIEHYESRIRTLEAGLRHTQRLTMGHAE